MSNTTNESYRRGKPASKSINPSRQPAFVPDPDDLPPRRGRRVREPLSDPVPADDPPETDPELLRSDYAQTFAEAKLSRTKTEHLITAYHEAGHLLGYLAADYIMPKDGGVGIVGDRFKFRRRGTLGLFLGYPLVGRNAASQILTAFEGENVGNLDVRGRALPMIILPFGDTDWEALDKLKEQLGEKTFRQCRVRAWKIVLDNLHFLRAAARQLFERRYLDAAAVVDLENHYPLKSVFFCVDTSAPAAVPAGLPPNPVEWGW